MKQALEGALSSNWNFCFFVKNPKNRLKLLPVFFFQKWKRIKKNFLNLNRNSNQPLCQIKVTPIMYRTSDEEPSLPRFIRNRFSLLPEMQTKLLLCLYREWMSLTRKLLIPYSQNIFHRTPQVIKDQMLYLNPQKTLHWLGWEKSRKPVRFMFRCLDCS